MTRAEKAALPFKLVREVGDWPMLFIVGPDSVRLAMLHVPNKRKAIAFARKLVETLNYGWRK